MTKDKHKVGDAFSLIEILVVIALFSFLAIITTRALVDTLRNTRKSENIIAVRSDLENAMTIMERTIKNKESVLCCDPGDEDCELVEESSGYLWYEDAEQLKGDTWGAFWCRDTKSLWHTDDYVPEDEAVWEVLLDEANYNIQCTFVCSSADETVPNSVSIQMTATEIESADTEEGASVTVQTEFGLRTY